MVRPRKQPELEETKPKIKPSKTTLRMAVYEHDSVCGSEIFQDVNEGVSKIDMSYFRERDVSATKQKASALFTENPHFSPISGDQQHQSFLSADFE